MCVWIYPWREIERQEERKRRISNSEFSWRRSIPAYRLSAKFAPLRNIIFRASRLGHGFHGLLDCRFIDSSIDSRLLVAPKESSVSLASIQTSIIEDERKERNVSNESELNVICLIISLAASSMGLF